jgi:hypothetical protein
VSAPAETPGFTKNIEEETMDRSTKNTLNEAIGKMAMVLQPEHWQALVAARGVAYPYAFTDKIRILRYLILDGKGGRYV